MLLGLFTGADDVVRGEAAQFGGVAVYALSGTLLVTLYVFGIGWAWKERRLGYGIVPVLSAGFFVAALAQIFGLAGVDSLEAIAAFYTSEAVSAFFVFTYRGTPLKSLMAALFSPSTRWRSRSGDL